MKNLSLVCMIFIALTCAGQGEYQILQYAECPTDEIGTRTESTMHISVNTNPVLMDKDGDGKPDITEMPPHFIEDIDQDGVPNHCDTDSDGDGIPDSEDYCYDVPGVPPLGCNEIITEREVYWLHGYQGTPESGLSIVSDYVKATYEVDPSTDPPLYNASQESLQKSAERVEEIMVSQNFGHNPERNFIIAHSLGGLVSRKMGMLRNDAGRKRFDGLITLATAHQGVYAADVGTYEPERIADVINDACRSLALGPVRESINPGSLEEFKQRILALIAHLGFIKRFVNSACDLISGPLFDLVLPIIEVGVEPELTTDSAPSLPPMATTNNAVFYATEYGQEDGTFTPRFLASLLPSFEVGDFKWESVQPQSFDLFQADASDEAGIALFESAMLHYQAKKESWDAAGAPWWLWAANPTAAYFVERIANNNRDGYKRGEEFFNRLDPSYQQLIGSLRLDIEQYGCDCIREDNYGNVYEIHFPNGSDCDNFIPGSGSGYWEYCTDSYTSSRNYYPSDGFILAESAMNADNVHYDVQHMEGSGHMQLKNDSNMEDAVEKIFEDGLGEGYFKTPAR